MAVSKRLRFEILRRDNHTCRYCGASAPDVPLRVDHVTPEALGGRTEPANLVTACEPCNSGKSSVALDIAMVEDIKADALRFAELTRQAYAVLSEQLDSRGEYWETFEQLWAHTFRLPMPSDAYPTIARWHDMAVPLELVIDAANISFGAHMVKDRFKYMCGIVWNQVQVVAGEVATKAALDGAYMTWSALVDAKYEWYEKGIEVGRAYAAEGVTT
jgi:hypothetical protein